MILVANGRATEFKGSVDDYPKWLAEHNRGGNLAIDKVDEEQPSKPSNTASAKKEQKRLEAEHRAQLQPITKRIKRAERVMEKLGAEKAKIEEQLADASLYDDENKDKLKQLLADQAYTQKELDQAEELWITASEEYEALS